MRNLRRALLCAAATTLTAGGLLVSPAQAAPAPLTPDGATTLAASIGATRTAGSYIDSATGRTVVAVTDRPPPTGSAPRAGSPSWSAAAPPTSTA